MLGRSDSNSSRKNCQIKMLVCLHVKTFSTFCCFCIAAYSISGLVFITMTIWLKAIDRESFSCIVHNNLNGSTSKRQIEQACFSKYSGSYNSPLPFYAFVVLSVGIYLLVSIVYYLFVRKRVDEIELKITNNESNTRTVWVFYAYLIHLVLCILLGIIFASLQYVYFFSNDFDESFSCVFSQEDQVKYHITRIHIDGNNLNRTLVKCTNDIASKENSLSIAVIVINSVFAVTAFVELIRILPRCCNLQANADAEFVRKYFLRI